MAPHRCPACGALHAETKPGPRVYRARSEKVGGCMGCGRHVTPHGSVPHEVVVIESPSPGGFQARYCPLCLLAIRAV